MKHSFENPSNLGSFKVNLNPISNEELQLINLLKESTILTKNPRRLIVNKEKPRTLVKEKIGSSKNPRLEIT